MTPKELAKKVRYIQIQTNRAVNDVLAGEYLSAFKGAGMEFEEVREYPDDYQRCVVAFEGNELSRGGGGARCMTMPLVRQAVQW